MKLFLKDNLLVLEVEGAKQNWAPEEGHTAEQVFGFVKGFLEQDQSTNDGRALVALKKLAHPVNLSQEMTVSAESPSSVENQPIVENTEQIQTPDPKSDSSQEPRGEAKKPIDSLEHPDNPSPSVDILGHDAEISLNEYFNQHNSFGSLNEAELNVSWRKTPQGLEVRINGQLYIYDPLDPDLTVDRMFEKMEAIGKHSKGKALGWLEAQRRNGNIRSYKVKDDEHSPKFWQKKVEEKLVEKGFEVINTLPSTDDWLCEFKAGEHNGSIVANLYSGEWTFSCASVKKEGVGLKALLDGIQQAEIPAKVEEEQKKPLSEADPTPFKVIVKDKVSGKEIVDSAFASSEQADQRVRDMQKAATNKPDIFVRKV